MKALVLADFGRLEVKDLPDPEPGPGEVLLRVDATGICGSDVHGFTGENGRRVPGQVMGHESVGHVAALGPGTDGHGLTIGQRVTFNPVVVPEHHLEQYDGREQHSPEKYVIGVRQDLVSSFAQLIAVPLRNVVALAEGMPLAHGALVEPLAVAVHAVRRVHVSADDAVLVVGGGPIGQSVVLALLMEGVQRILVSEVDRARRELVAALGATVVDPTSGAALPEAVQATFGGLADVAVDAVGSSQTLGDALRATQLGGSVCLVGMANPEITLEAYRVSTDERSVVGSFTYSARDFLDAAAWIPTASDVAAQLISREVPLSGADAAFAGLAAGDGTPGKVLVRLHD